MAINRAKPKSAPPSRLPAQRAKPQSKAQSCHAGGADLTIKGRSMDALPKQARATASDVKLIREALLAAARTAWAEHPGDDGLSARVGHVQGFMRGEFAFELMLWLDGAHMNDVIKKLLMRVAPTQRPSERSPITWRAPQQTSQDDLRPANSATEPNHRPPVGGQAQQTSGRTEPNPASSAAPLSRADLRRKEEGKFAERYANLYLFKTLDGRPLQECTAGELLKDADKRESPENLARVSRQERRLALFERNLAHSLTSNTVIGEHYAKRDDLWVDAFNRAEQVYAT